MIAIGVYLAEFLGTFLLVLIGDGTCANVLLKDTKGEKSGWIVISSGWGLAVAIGVYISGWISGGHINPAVTLGFASIGKVQWKLVPGYILFQFLGAFTGALIVYLAYMGHFAKTEDSRAKLSVFSTEPEIRSFPQNFITELIATFVLVIAVLGVTNENNQIGSLGALIIGLVVWAIGLSLGGPTGFAINPARDTGPRAAHALLPIPGKGSSDWKYGLVVPLFGPILGGVIGAWVYFGFILSI
jgi:glycerol uptake facilitator protein